MKKYKYAVVENSGYKGEHIVKNDFQDIEKAYAYVGKKYGEDEKASLNVQVAMVLENGDLTYDYF
ncbi:MAG: hypothetical protein ACKO0Z_09715 [Betaproteobacteria bacterium]